MEALISQIGFIRYQRDLPTLNYHFSKLGPEGWKNLVEGSDGPPDPYQERARAIWLEPYDLPEFKATQVHKGAARDFLHALKKKRVPQWVLSIAPFGEIQKAGGEQE